MTIREKQNLGRAVGIQNKNLGAEGGGGGGEERPPTLILSPWKMRGFQKPFIRPCFCAWSKTAYEYL